MAVFGALLACGCAGARVSVSAENARYPVSLSGVVRDKSGRIYNRHSLTKVESFSAQRTPVGVVYSAWTVPSTYDISDAINLQVASSCGEAVVNLAISVSSSCTVLNSFPFLNVLPSWPGCVPLTITGDIVRRAEAGCPDGSRALTSSGPGPQLQKTSAATLAQWPALQATSTAGDVQ
jgi:hypothetical protein